MKSIYVLDEKYKSDVLSIIDGMKVIMIKGVGYLSVGKKTPITPELLRNFADSMERQNIKSL